MKKRKGLKVFVILLICLAAATAIFSGVCVVLANQDHIQDKYTLTDKNDGFLWTVLKSALTGSEFDASEAEVNTYLNKTFCTEGQLLKNVRVYFHQEKPCEIYARINYHGHDRALSAFAEISFDKEQGVAGVKIHDVKIGELPVIQLAVDNILSDFAGKHALTEYRDGILYVRTHYEYSFGDFNFQLQLEELAPEQGSIRCKTNSMSAELLKGVVAYLRSDSGQELFKKLFGETANRLKDFAVDLFF